VPATEITKFGHGEIQNRIIRRRIISNSALLAFEHTSGAEQSINLGNGLLNDFVRLFRKNVSNGILADSSLIVKTMRYSRR
jgi:hypothetical protein